MIINKYTYKYHINWYNSITIYEWNIKKLSSWYDLACTSKENMKEKKARMIGDSRDKFKPNSIKKTLWPTNKICKRSYHWLIDISIMPENYCIRNPWQKINIITKILIRFHFILIIIYYSIDVQMGILPVSTLSPKLLERNLDMLGFYISIFIV